MLTKNQLEYLKHEVGTAIIDGIVAYGKDTSNKSEVFSYARSMVMNHLKKAKELNGNQIYGVGPADVRRNVPKALANINMDLLSEDLKAFVNTLVE